MGKRLEVLAGSILILVGVLALAFTFGVPLLGWEWAWAPWQLWPLVVVAVGLFFVLPPLMVRGRRGLGGLFIPGVPILTTGAILLLASVTGWWEAWAWLWPLEVLAVAMGFLLAAIYIRAIGLIVPATIIGANGLVLQFCVLSGLWDAWAVLWTVEPLALGLALLLMNIKIRSAGLFLAGVILCGLAGFFLVMMTIILAEWRWVGLVGPVLLIVLGIFALVWGGLRRPATTATSQ